jgi:hypothetical protein
MTIFHKPLNWCWLNVIWDILWFLVLIVLTAVLSHYMASCTETYQYLHKEIKLHHNTSQPLRFLSPKHHFLHEIYNCNTRSAMIALTATSPTTIHLLSLVWFGLFDEKLHSFYHTIFVTWLESWPEAGEMGLRLMWVDFYTSLFSIHYSISLPHRCLHCCLYFGPPGLAAHQV